MKENQEENLVYGVLTIFALPFLMISSLWTTYIIWDICTLFNLMYLTQYGYEVFFGSVFVLGLLASKFKNSGKEKPIKEAFTEIIGVQVGYFFIWALAYLLHWIITK